MKSYLILISVLAVMFSCKPTPEYIGVAENFMQGVLQKDTTMIKPYCTPTTMTTMKFVIAQDTRIVKEDVKFKLKLVKDQVAKTGDTAWVWFVDGNHEDQKFMTRLVKVDNQWKVDEPK